MKFEFKREPTKSQKVMLGLMAVAFTSLIAWTIPEVQGVLSGDEEDTYSELVWDAPFPTAMFISILHFIAGGLFTWSGGHFLEGYGRRRAIEKDHDHPRHKHKED